MVTRYITPKEYASYLQKFVGREINESDHIVDGILVFKSGKKYLDRVDSVTGKTLKIYSREFVLRVWGFWKYVDNGKVIESTNMKLDEDGVSFKRRMASFLKTINPTRITDIKVSKQGRSVQIYLDSGGKFIVRKFKESLVNYSNCELDNGDNAIAYHSAQLEASTGKLINIEN